MDQGFSLREPVAWALLALGGIFAVLGAFFLLLPAGGGELFGIGAGGGAASAYVRAVALRDLALALYLILQTLFATRRAVMVLLLATMVIPAGDLLLVSTAPGGDPSRLPLHLASLGCFAALALWVRRSAAG